MVQNDRLQVRLEAKARPKRSLKIVANKPLLDTENPSMLRISPSNLSSAPLLFVAAIHTDTERFGIKANIGGQVITP